MGKYIVILGVLCWVIPFIYHLITGGLPDVEDTKP